MNLEELFKLPTGAKFLYEENVAEVLWVDKVRFLTSKGNPNGNPPTSDNYFQNTAIAFTVEGRNEPITIVSYWPRPKEVNEEKCQPIPPNFRRTPNFTETFTAYGRIEARKS